MTELSVPKLDFSFISELPQVYKQAQADALRQQTLANLGQGNSADAQALLKSGDLSLAQLGLNLRNRTEDQARQAQRDTVGDQHWNASFGLQKRAADRADEGPVEQAGYRAQVAQKYGIDPNSPEGRTFIVGGKLPDPNGTELGTATQRAAVARQYGLDPATQEGRAFVLTGKLPERDQFSPVTQPQVGQPQAVAPQSGATIDPNEVDPKTNRREGYLQTIDPKTADYIKKVADYEIDPRTTSNKGGMREKLMTAVAHYDPTYDQNTFSSRAKAIKDFSTGPQGNIIRSFDVAVDHLDTLQKAATAMQNGDTRAINALRNAWREQTGSDLPTNFKSLVPLVSGEIAKAVIGSNNALSDREELRANLQAAQSPAQISGVISSYKALMGGQLKGLKKQYEETTGKKDFENRIREVTRKELEPSQGNGADSMLRQARDAISQGAPRDKVIERLKGAGIDASGL